MKKEIKLTSKVYNELAKLGHNFIPTSHLLGQNEEGIIDSCIKLLSNGNGCENMQEFSSEEMNRVSLSLFKRNRIPVGLTRIGEQIRLGSYRTRGNSLIQLARQNKDFFVLSYGGSVSKMTAEVYDLKKKKAKKYSIISVVKNERR